ncbi:hypothetical protein EV359DRAFT_87519 [Lentinula novae-zelandiae]|nr:hypothetical protein EV359DRAFT_87519 [Lentinula novae-zelandiae]
MSTSRTTTQTTSNIGSILITGGTDNQTPAPICPPMPKEEAARQAAEEEKQREEAAARPVAAAAAAVRSRQGPSPSEATTSAPRVEVEIPRNEASGGDPDDGGNGGDDEEDDVEDERAPCERCYNKKIPCLEQVRREGGPSGERLAVMESQMAQGLADVRSLREAMTRTSISTVDGGISGPRTVQDRVGEAKASEEKKGQGGN